jgi:hypothetical protein
MQKNLFRKTIIDMRHLICVFFSYTVDSRYVTEYILTRETEKMVVIQLDYASFLKLENDFR